MLKKKEEAREQIEFISLEMMIPQNHLLRKIEKAINFDKIYKIVEPLYSEKVDPVVLLKIVMIQHMQVRMRFFTNPSWIRCCSRT